MFAVKVASSQRSKSIVKLLQASAKDWEAQGALRVGHDLPESGEHVNFLTDFEGHIHIAEDKSQRLLQDLTKSLILL